MTIVVSLTEQMPTATVSPSGSYPQLRLKGRGDPDRVVLDPTKRQPEVDLYNSPRPCPTCSAPDLDERRPAPATCPAIHLPTAASACHGVLPNSTASPVQLHHRSLPTPAARRRKSTTPACWHRTDNGRATGGAPVGEIAWNGAERSPFIGADQPRRPARLCLSRQPADSTGAAAGTPADQHGGCSRSLEKPTPEESARDLAEPAAGRWSGEATGTGPDTLRATGQRSHGSTFREMLRCHGRRTW